MSLYTETFTGGISDNLSINGNSISLKFNSVSEKSSDLNTRISGGSTVYKNSVTFLKTGLILSYVKFHAYQSNTYTLRITNNNGVTVVNDISVSSSGNSWITFSLPNQIKLTNDILYTVSITAASSDSAVYSNGQVFNGNYWSCSTSNIGTSAYSEALSMEFGFIMSEGYYIANPLDWSTKPASVLASIQSTIPTNTSLALKIAISTSSLVTPAIWSDFSSGQIIKDILFTMDLSNKYVWLKYVLSSNNTTDSPSFNGFQLEQYIPTTTEMYPYKNEDSWLGIIPIFSVIDYQTFASRNSRIKVVNVNGNTSYIPMEWDDLRKRFYGLVKIASLYKQETPKNGNLSVNTEISDLIDFSTISQSSTAQSILNYDIFRRTSVDGSYKNMTFKPVYDGTKWQYTITNFAIYTGGITGDKNNVVVTIPFHPLTANILIKSVYTSNSKYAHDNGISPLPNGEPIGTGDAWWWDDTDHKLYIRFATLGNIYLDASQQVNCTTVKLIFESDTDLFATRYDVIQTGNIGQRNFYNGLILSNRYYCTSILGDTARQVDTHVMKDSETVSIVVDCMERVAVHVDNTIGISSNTPDYKANIVWKNDFWNYIYSENNNEIQIKTVSDPSKWAQQVTKKISVERIVSIRSNSRMGKQDYKLTNNDSVARTYPFVWGKEPWASDDRQVNDRGIFAGDLDSVRVDTKRPISSLSKKYMLHYDSVDFVGMGVMFPQLTDGNAYFIKNAPIYNTSPWADYPIPVNSYPDYYDVDSMFFEKVFTNVQPNESVYVSFYQGQYAGNSFTDLYLEIDDDYSTLFPTQTTVTGQTLRILEGGIAGYLSFDIRQHLYKYDLLNNSTQQILYLDSFRNSDTKQSIFNETSQTSDTKQSVYKINSISFDTLLRLIESGIVKTINFDTRQIKYRQAISEFILKQIIYSTNQNLFHTKQSIFTNEQIDADTLQKLVDILITHYQYEDINFNISRTQELTAEILRKIDLELTV